jgi:hypothetical protein
MSRPLYTTLNAILAGCILLSAHTFARDKASIALTVNGLAFRQNVLSVFVLPGEIVSVQTTDSTIKRPVLASPDFLTLNMTEGSWHLKAPIEPGVYSLTLHAFTPIDPVHINVFVLMPMSKLQDGLIEGYRIDPYPTETFRDLPKYLTPPGFVRVSKENIDMKVSAHFTLRQFLCKQESDFPKFLVMQSTTLMMLEDLLAKVNEQGIKIDTFGFISGYRTPFYNRSIGNVKNSRHAFGDAIDILIDADKNGVMDDLNNDGKTTIADVDIFYDLVSRFQDQSKGKYVGGIGRYAPKPHHGGFVHIDNRGYQARW